MGDVNGDGKDDYTEFVDGTDYANVWLSLGNGYFQRRSFTPWPGYVRCPPPTCARGTSTATGKTDFFHILANSFVNVWISNGDGSFSVVGAPTAANRVADVNGDGMTDLVGQGTQLISRGDGTFAGGEAGPSVGMGAILADINGDGKTDFFAPNDGASNANTYLSTGIEPGLLTSVQNPNGGVVAIQYAPSSVWPNTNNPSVTPTVSSVTSYDGRGGAATTNYSYAGGLVDRVDRRFLGFHVGTQTGPCADDCPSVTSTYDQNYGSISKPAEVDRRSKNGVLMTSDIYEYTTNGATLPYTSQMTGNWKYTYDGTGGTACRAQLQAHVHPAGLRRERSLDRRGRLRRLRRPGRREDARLFLLAQSGGVHHRTAQRDYDLQRGPVRAEHHGSGDRAALHGGGSRRANCSNRFSSATTERRLGTRLRPAAS